MASNLHKSLSASIRETAPSRAVAPSIILLLFIGLASTPKVLAQGGTGSIMDVYSENFDGVSAPALPTGWTTTTTGTGVPFQSVGNSPETAPNAARVTLGAGAGSSSLKSPVIPINLPAAVLSFRHNFDTESGWDGGNFQILVNGQPYYYFYPLGNRYTGILRGTDNPLSGYSGWTGNSNGFVTSSFQLPELGQNYNIQLIWTAAHDNSFGDGEWLIDSVSITSSFTGTNSNTINISSSGPASPYPSQIEFTDLYGGGVEQIVVRIHNFSHTHPDDVDLMLVGPDNRKVILMSDMGGSTPVNNVTLTFYDGASNYLPVNGPLTTGAYKPTNYSGDSDDFPEPAPQGTPGATLATFFGSFPNGIYKLFLVDDRLSNVGSISGWSISIRRSQDICDAQLQVIPYLFPGSGGNGTLQITTQAGCAWMLVGYIPPWVELTSKSSGTGSGNVTFSVFPNTTGGNRTGSFTLSTPTDVYNTIFFQSP